jgi:hypothetical protein
VLIYVFNLLLVKKTSGQKNHHNQRQYTFKKKLSLFVTKISANGKPARSRTRFLTHYARKRKRKEVLTNYNKTRINIAHQHDSWMEFKEVLRVQAHEDRVDYYII